MHLPLCCFSEASDAIRQLLHTDDGVDSHIFADIIDTHLSVVSTQASPQRLTIDASTFDPSPNGLSASGDHLQDDTITLVSANGQPIDGELAEDVMDISRSEVDEGEITDYSPEPPVIPQAEADPTEHEDVYEPPPIIDVEPTATPMPSGVDLRREATEVVPDASSAGATDGLAKRPQLADVSMMDLGDAVKMSAPHSQSPSPSVNFTNDSDDYEPPEPVSPAEMASVNMDDEVVQQAPTQLLIHREDHAHPVDQDQDQRPMSGSEAATGVMAEDFASQSRQKVGTTLLEHPKANSVSRQ